MTMPSSWRSRSRRASADERSPDWRVSSRRSRVEWPLQGEGRFDGLDRLASKADGKLIDVTAITPTKAGEGKTTTSVSHTGPRPSRRRWRWPARGLTRARLRDQGRRSRRRLYAGRPHGGPEPRLHGRIDAIGAAYNLLAAMLEAHICTATSSGSTCSRSAGAVHRHQRPRLRDVAIGLGGKANGYPRHTGFDITAASEVMAIACRIGSPRLRERLGAITVAH